MMRMAGVASLSDIVSDRRRLAGTPTAKRKTDKCDNGLDARKWKEEEREKKTWRQTPKEDLSEMGVRHGARTVARDEQMERTRRLMFQQEREDLSLNKSSLCIRYHLLGTQTQALWH